MSRKSFPPFHPDACPPSHALLQLTSPGSILKKTVVNANGYLVFEQGLSLYKDTYAFLCKIPRMLWGTRGIRANTLNFQTLHERERYHRSLKRSSQSNCGLELRVIFFPSFLFFNLNSLMHWSYKSAACEREGFATGSFTRRMTGMQHVFQTWIRVPQADPQSKQPSLCH